MTPSACFYARTVRRVEKLDACEPTLDKRVVGRRWEPPL